MLDWSTVTYFGEDEFAPRPDLVSPTLVYALDELRDALGVPLVVHNSWAAEGHEKDSRHYKGEAVDLHAVGVTLLDFWLMAERHLDFGGIGVYPFWAAPGLHLDVRREGLRARWWRDRQGNYQALTGKSLRALMTLMDQPSQLEA